MSCSEWIQLGMAVVTFGLAVATIFLAAYTYKIVKENKAFREQYERQFRISKNPIFDVSIGGKVSISEYFDKTEKKLHYFWGIPLKIKNVGYGPAFNIYPRLKQGNFEYKFNSVGSKFVELGFSLGVGAEETLNFEVSNITGEALKQPLQIEIKCDDIFKKKVAHKFEGLTGQSAEYTVFNLKSIDFG